MQFIVENEAFAKALALVKSCIPSRSTIPILSHVAVEAKAENVLVIRATCLDREIEAKLPAEVATPGSAALPGEVLAAMARKLTKGGQSEFAVKDDRCKIKSGSSKYDLRTLPAADFPTAKALDEGAVAFAVDAAELRGIIQATVYAAADRTDNRSFLRGVYLHVSDRKLVAVATNGLRLALKSTDMPKNSATMPSIILPTDTAKQMVEFLAGVEGEVDLAVSSKMVELQWPGFRFASQLVEGDYPDYQRFIPKPNGHGVGFRPYALSEAIDRASVVYLGETNTDARIPFASFAAKDGAIQLQCGEKRNEQATEVVEAETNGVDLSFRTNAGHMTEMLGTWPESVAVQVQQAKEGAPILFFAPELPSQLMVVMPSMKG